MIRLDFETTPADWDAFQQHAGALVRGLAGYVPSRWSWRSSLLAIPAGVLVFIAAMVIRFDVPTAVVTLGLVVLFAVFNRWQLATALAPMPRGAVVGHRNLIVDDEGVVEESANHRHQSKWSGVIGIHETRDHVFVMIDRFAGYIVPKRAIHDPATLTDVVAFARAHIDPQR